MGMLYVLDQPSIGLHPKDNVKTDRHAPRACADIGNTVVVVEHDEDTIRAADHLVEMGPGPGVHGGESVVQGTIAVFLEMQSNRRPVIPLWKRSIATPSAERPGADRARRAREQPR